MTGCQNPRATLINQIARRRDAPDFIDINAFSCQKNNFPMVGLTPLGRLLMVQKELRCRTGNCFFDPKKHFGTTLVFPCYTATKPHWTHVNGQEEHNHKSSSSPVEEIPLISSTSKRIHTKKLLPDGPSHSYGTYLYGAKKETKGRIGN